MEFISLFMLVYFPMINQLKLINIMILLPYDININISKHKV